MKKITLGLLLFTSLSISTGLQAYGNSFTCPIGKNAACLDYSDQVCSSFSKCVSDDAVCFDSFTCNYKGFVCKSQLDEVYDQYNQLLTTCQDMAGQHDDLVDSYNELHDKHNRLVDEFISQNDCINRASSLQEARTCLL